MTLLSEPQTFRELMTIEQVAADFFIAQSPDYKWGRLYGGQVVAQALRAAYATVDAPHRVHSLHAYFVLGGVPKQQVLLEVDRLRDGKSFTTRRVVAHQAGGAILNLNASFHRVEEDVDVQINGLPDELPSPDDSPSYEWTGIADVREPPKRTGNGRSWVWMKIREHLGDIDGPDGPLHDCALAYLSDHNAIDAIVTSHPLGGGNWEKFMTASLDHNVWFHRRVRADEWVLFDMQARGLNNARGIGIGAVHSVGGVQAATVAQEGLIRAPRT